MHIFYYWCFIIFFTEQGNKEICFKSDEIANIIAEDLRICIKITLMLIASNKSKPQYKNLCKYLLFSNLYTYNQFLADIKIFYLISSAFVICRHMDAMPFSDRPALFLEVTQRDAAHSIITAYHFHRFFVGSLQIRIY